MLLEAIPEKTPAVTFMGLFSNPRRIYCEKGAPMLKHFAKDDDILEGFTEKQWAKFSMSRKGPDALHVYNILPYPDHDITDIGTFMASASPQQPCPKIDMVVRGGSLQRHFMQLYEAGIKYPNKQYDILDLITVKGRGKR